MRFLRSCFVGLSFCVAMQVQANPLSDAAGWLQRQTGLGTQPAPTREPPASEPPRARPERALPAASTAPAASCRVPPVPATIDGRNKACLAAAGALAAQRGDTLTLRMDDGSRKTFTDKQTSGDVGYGYALVDFNPATHLFVVGDIGRDATTYTLVDGRTGAQIPTGRTEPFVSPDGRFVFEITDGWKVDLRAAGDARDIVWDAEKAGKRLSDIEVLGWRDERRLMLRASDKRVDLLRSEDGHWVFDESPSPAPPTVVAKPRKGLAKDVARCGVAEDYGLADTTVATDACEARLGELAASKDGTLVLALADGSTKTFPDAKEEGEGARPPFATTHEIVAFSRAAHVFVIEESRRNTSDGQQDHQWFTVDSQTGAARDFERFPYVSPDGGIALVVAADGTMRLVDLAKPDGDALWRFVGDATGKVSPHTIFLGWDDPRRARVLIDDARVLTISRGDDGAWSASAAPLVKAYEPSDVGCAMPKPDSSLEAEDADERRCLAAIPAIASRGGDVLTLRLEDGATTREVSRRVDNDKSAIYHLVAYQPKQHRFVIGARFYDEGNWYLIDSISGERTQLDGQPIFSPGGTGLVCIVGFSGEGIADVVIRGGGPHPGEDWSYQPPQGGKPITDATLLAWRGEDRVELKIDKKLVTVARGGDGTWKVVARPKGPAKPKASVANKPAAPRP